MAKYLMSVWGPDSDYEKENYGYASPEEMMASFEATGKFNDKLQEEGYFVFADGLDAAKTATVVDGQGEKPVITDGPYAEAKEYMAGFWIIDVPDLDVALKLAGEASAACLGKVEVRPMQTGPEA
ncbi:YciI family protein [Nocardioides sp. NPDC057577]|uniref:YciI family protein n=1 Tax=unclassified Nocardioides TaxID=2615069 RepID=UPI0036674A59